MEDYKEKIVDFIEGRTAPEIFYIWLESNSQVLDWLQIMMPQEKTSQDIVEEKIDYFLKDTPKQKQDEIYSAYQSLCEHIEIEQAKKLVDLLNELDAKTVRFTDHMNLLLYNFKSVLDNPSNYKSSYVQYMCASVKEFFEKEYTTIQEVPYDVKRIYCRNKTNSKLYTYVNIQSWLYHLMTEIYPNESIQKDESLHNKASFIMAVCPEYIDGYEIEEACIIENIIERVPEELPEGKRKKLIKELIKKEFHIEGTKYPRWIQGGEWPVGEEGVPMKFISQKRKKGKAYGSMLFTEFLFEDVKTGEQRIIEQFT